MGVNLVVAVTDGDWFDMLEVRIAHTKSVVRRRQFLN
jgi:hypothetical protein